MYTPKNSRHFFTLKCLYIANPQILACLPRSWFADLPGEATLPGLENLCRYLTTAAATLEKATLHRTPEERMEAR